MLRNQFNQISEVIRCKCIAFYRLSGIILVFKNNSAFMRFSKPNEEDSESGMLNSICFVESNGGVAYNSIKISLDAFINKKTGGNASVHYRNTLKTNQ